MELNSPPVLPARPPGLHRQAASLGTDRFPVNAHTAAVLAIRKLLMYIAVKQGATAGQSFLDYVNYLADKGYVPLRAERRAGEILAESTKRGGNRKSEMKVITNGCKVLVPFAILISFFLKLL